MKNIKVATFNCRGLRDSKKQDWVVDHLLQEDIDVILLQDTRYQKRSHAFAFRKRFKLSSWFSLSNGPSAGVAIVINPNLKHEFLREEADNEGRFILVELKIEDKRYAFVSVYAPSKDEDRKKFYNNIPLHVGDSSGSLIMGGDFNATIASNRESQNRKGTSKRHLQVLAETLRVTETWRYAKDQANRFSWKGPDGNKTQIDYVFVAEDLEN